MRATAMSIQRLLTDLRFNLASGARLALGLPVRLLLFRVGVAQLLALVGVDIAISIVIDRLRSGPSAVFSMHAIVYEGFIITVLLMFALLLAATMRQPHLRLAIPVLTLASEPMLSVLSVLLTLRRRADHRLRLPGAVDRLLGAHVLGGVRLLASRGHRADAAASGLSGALARRRVSAASRDPDFDVVLPAVVVP